MHTRHFLSLIVVILFCAIPANPLQAAMADTALIGEAGMSAVTARSARLQVPSDTAAMSNTPSGQGSERYEDPSSPQPLYAPGPVMSGSRGFAGLPAWAQSLTPFRSGSYPPFGANLFQGYFAGTFYEGLNADYVVMPGDRIMVRIWGAQQYADTLLVDQQGNIFLPEAGPMHVAGIKHGSLQSSIKQFLSSTFTTNVNVYANLLSAQPVAVYVTGFVTRPGRYAGGPNDTVLYYLDRAGGIIPDRGSYRDITIQRNGKVLARVDLYSFILNGEIKGGRLRDGDVIVVGPKGDSVIADGLIPQHASYESRGKTFTGSDLIRLAAPLPAVSHVGVSGSRNATPFHIYMNLTEFAHFSLAANDWVEFLADRPGDTIMVAVSGSILGPTRFPIKRNTSLRSLLAHVQTDPGLSNLEGIYLKRRSVAEQQKKALSDALFRLENSVLTATSATQETSAIRVQEAELVQNFVKRASQLEPDGVVVVTRNGVSADILLEDGDEIVIPQRSDVIQIAGEVMIPKAIVYEKGAGTARYVYAAGGFTERANQKDILVVHPNGEIALANNTDILPGDLLLVMPEYDSKSFSVFKDIINVLYQIAIATKVVIAP